VMLKSLKRDLPGHSTEFSYPNQSEENPSAITYANAFSVARKTAFEKLGQRPLKYATNFPAV